MRTALTIDVEPQIVELTGTPWRAGHGFIAHRGERDQSSIFDDIAYEISYGDLLEKGFLVPVRGRRVANQIDVAGVATDRFGDYKITELAQRVDDASVTERCVYEFLSFAQRAGRRCWLVFAVTIDHAEHIAAEIRTRGFSCETVSANMPARARADVVANYRDGNIDCLVSVACLSTGFDVPAVDLIGLMRPTKSPALYAQMLCRGSRPSPGKEDCIVMDFGGACLEHGPVEAIEWRALTRTPALKAGVASEPAG